MAERIQGPLYRAKRAIHNGADDNASGTAALIETGRTIAAACRQKKQLPLIAFSGEEKGLLGSNYFVKHPYGRYEEGELHDQHGHGRALKPDEKPCW
jgi:Zn-dependent M28 family amino/carboxypeptidase